MTQDEIIKEATNLGVKLASDLIALGAQETKAHRIEFKGGTWPLGEIAMGGMNEDSLARFFKSRLAKRISENSLAKHLASKAQPTSQDSAWNFDDIDVTNCNSNTLEQFCRDNIRLAPFFAMLASKLAAQSAPSESVDEHAEFENCIEPVAEIRCRNGEVFGFIGRQVFRDMLQLGTKLYTKPQTTSQDVLNAERYRWLRNNVKEELTIPSNNIEFMDLRTHWKIKPYLVATTCINSQVSFDDAIDDAMKEGKQ